MLPAPLPFSLGVPGADAGLFTASGYQYNYAIAGLPFLSAASRENPIVRSTAEYRKQQFDNSNEPGEQSLDGWWIRSQQSFHGGAGQLFGDPSAGDPSFSAIRFWQSKGINPWTPGEIRLLPRVETVSTDAVSSWETDSTRAIGRVGNTDIYFVDPDGAYTTEPADPLVHAVTLDGDKYWYASAAAVWSRPYTDSLGTNWDFEWDLVDDQAYVVLRWVKERLVLACDTGVYELVGAGTALPDPKWTPPSGTWQPTSITETNTGILVAGVTAGGKSVILNFTLDGTGALPVLASGVVVTTLPQGETINEIYGYLGRFLGISTSQGPRIATVGDDGSLEVGPLLFDGSTAAWVARGQYLYTAASMPEWVDDEGGLCRIDLGLQVADLRFAYASDIYSIAAGGMATTAGLLNGQLYIGSSGGLYREVLGEYMDTGYLTGSRIRYDTLEPKVYKLLRARGPTLTSDYFISVIDPDGDESNVVGYSSGQTPGATDVSLPNLGPLDYLSVKFTLSSSDDNMESAVASGYQLKSLPAQPRQRMIRLPLWCFDEELDRAGNRAGYDGSAMDRLLALEDVDRRADTVTFQDLDRDAVSIVAIDTMEFAQTAPPSHVRGWGGIITLTLRTI